ncbi:MAG TPA: hypothetical protein VGF45_13755 [Polyangia bacterium]
MLALVVASRFGMLLGLALWVGLGTALLLTLPVIERHLDLPKAREVGGAVTTRLDLALFVAVLLVIVALGARVVIDRAAPPAGLILPVAIMTVARLLSALTFSPALRALLARMRDEAAPASDAEKAAFARLASGRGLLLTLEVCLSLYALYAVS